MKESSSGVLSYTYNYSYFNCKNIRFWKQKIILTLSQTKKTYTQPRE